MEKLAFISGPVNMKTNIHRATVARTGILSVFQGKKYIYLMTSNMGI